MSDEGAWNLEGIEHSKSMERVSHGPMLRDNLGVARDIQNWPVWLLVIVCVVVLIAQWATPLSYEVWGFSAKAMKEGRYATLLTSLFMHGGVLHIWMNLSAYLSLAPIVCARFGKGFAAVIPFYLFFILCGLAGNCLYWLIHPHGNVPVVGASGAIYGVFAAAFRLDITRDRLRGLFSKSMRSAWRWLLVSNVMIVLLFGGPAILVQIMQGHVTDLRIPIAWEAHLGGFLAGLVLISVMAGRGWKGDWRAGIKAREYLLADVQK